MKYPLWTAATLIALLAACTGRDAAETNAVENGAAGPAEASSGKAAPYEIRMLDGRITVDTQYFEVPVRLSDTIPALLE